VSGACTYALISCDAGGQHDAAGGWARHTTAACSGRCEFGGAVEDRVRGRLGVW
jgi:hypothetical protein